MIAKDAEQKVTSTPASHRLTEKRRSSGEESGTMAVLLSLEVVELTEARPCDDVRRLARERG
jgi:hypothetical protein